MQHALPLALIPDAFIAPVSVGFSVAVALFTAYWLVMATGLLDHDAYDGTADTAAGLLLHFFFGHAPPLLVLSLSTLTAWVAAVAIAPGVADWPAWQQLLLDIPLLAGGMLAGRLLSFPVSRIYQKTREADAREQAWSPIGMLARVVSHEVCDKSGQIEVNKGGPTVLLAARAKGGQTFRIGDVVNIVAADVGSGFLVDSAEPR
jgi:hypothetical protein